MRNPARTPSWVEGMRAAPADVVAETLVARIVLGAVEHGGKEPPMISWLALALVLSIDPFGSGAGRAACVGDCDGDGTVGVDEAVIGVGIALGHIALSRCDELDRNGDRTIGIDELVAAVDASVNTCEPSAGGLRLEPVGGEFRVNAATTGLRGQSQVAMDDSGGFIAIWGDTMTEEDNFGLAGRHFLSDGSPATPLDFAVNTFTLDAQRTQDVTLQANGSGLAVWETSGIFLDDDDVRAGIYGRHFDTSGMPLLPDFKINTNDVDDIREDQPVAAPLNDGSFMVAWAARENLIAGRVLIAARRVDAAGLPTGDEFVVTQYTGFQDHPAVAPLPDGGFVVVWQDAYRDGLSSGIFGQRFDSDAGRVGSEFLVNTYTFGPQRFPAVAAGADGSFLVTWAGILTGDEQIIARHFDGAGEPVGSEFEVNRTGELGQQSYPSVAAEPQGGFLVVWMSGGSIGRFNIYGQRIARNSALVGSEFQVNTFTSTMLDRAFPEVASNPDGDVVVVWEGQGQDGGTTGDVTVRGQRYRVVDPLAEARLVTLNRNGKVASRFRPGLIRMLPVPSAGRSGNHH
jgi:hypothetical protein